MKSPTSPCGTPCCPAGPGDRTTRPGWSRRYGHCRPLYQALRIAVTDAVQTLPGTDSDRASYQIAVGTAQMLVTSATNVIPQTPDLAGDIGRAVLASLHGPGRPPVCDRTGKSPLGRRAPHPPRAALGD